MMTNFYDSFGNKANTDQEIPEEILNSLNTELPNNLMYYQNEQGKWETILKPNIESLDLKVDADFDNCNEHIKETLKKIPMKNWVEYLYRIQSSLPVKNTKIGDEIKLIPIEKTIGNPLSPENVKVDHCRIYPSRFQEPTCFTFESDEKDETVIRFQQQIYDNYSEIKYSNIDFDALKIDIYIYSPLSNEDQEGSRTSSSQKVCVDYSVTPTKAKSVSDAIKALHLFRGLFTGSTKVNGVSVASKNALKRTNSKQIEELTDFWEKALSLETKIGVKFDPRADFSMDDLKLFSELDTCFNDGKNIVWKHPFDHFHAEQIKKENLPNGTENENGLVYKFIEGPIQCSLLGADFELYSLTKINWFIITNIEWDKDKEDAGEVYISDAPNHIWELSRHFMTKKDSERIAMSLS